MSHHLPHSNEEMLQRVISIFWEAFMPTWRAIRAHLRETASQQFDITEEQFHILRHVSQGVCSVSELAQAKQISRPAISQVVDILVNKGLMERSHHESDRRFIHLQLTPNGAALLAAIFEANRGWMKEKLAKLNDQELDSIVVGLSNLRAVIVTDTHLQY